MVIAERLHPDLASPERVPVEECVERVLRGEILRLRGALPALGWLDRFRALTFECVSEVASSDSAARLDREGFESAHRVLSGREITALQSRLVRRFFDLRLPICRSFARDLFGARTPLYVADRAWVRWMVPIDAEREDVRHLAHRPGSHTRPNYHAPLRPHRDTWLSLPRDTLGLWMAISRVRLGNTMVLYPDAFGRPLEPEPDGFLTDVESLGRPLRFECDPGDVVVFSGHHLHATEPNRTDETRYQLGLRFCFGAPRYGAQSTWVPFSDERLLGTSFSPIATLRSRVTFAHARYRVRDLRARLSRGN